MIDLPKFVKLDSCEFTFYQDSDSCELNKDGQILKVKIDDGGGGNFLILSTERWSLDYDEIDEFIKILTQIKEFTGK
jgi:hypothetical protein